MTFLILAIFCSTVNQMLFKVFSRFRINLLSVIAVNYAVCMVIGYGSAAESSLGTSIFLENWYLFSILQGILFVMSFFLWGITTEKHGVTPAVMSTRLAVAIPTVAAFFLYGDILTSYKMIGISAALFALYLSCTTPKSTSKSLKTLSLLPIILFMSFGIHSTLLKFVQERFLDASSYHAYTMASFFSAFLFSGSVLTWRLVKKQQTFRWGDLLSGIVLGTANYGAIYFLIRALSVPGRQSSQLFPTLSLSVVIFSALGAWAFFKERPSRRMLLALLFGAGAIVLVNLSV